MYKSLVLLCIAYFLGASTQITEGVTLSASPPLSVCLLQVIKQTLSTSLSLLLQVLSLFSSPPASSPSSLFSSLHFFGFHFYFILKVIFIFIFATSSKTSELNPYFKCFTFIQVLMEQILFKFFLIFDFIVLKYRRMIQRKLN